MKKGTSQSPGLWHYADPWHAARSLSAINMTAAKAPGAQSREISRRTSVTIQCLRRNASLPGSKCRIHFLYNQRTLSGWILHLCGEELRIGWLLLYDYWYISDLVKVKVGNPLEKFDMIYIYIYKIHEKIPIFSQL